MLISSPNISVDTLRIKFDKISGHLVAQSSWYINLATIGTHKRWCNTTRNGGDFDGLREGRVFTRVRKSLNKKRCCLISSLSTKKNNSARTVATQVKELGWRLWEINMWSFLFLLKPEGRRVWMMLSMKVYLLWQGRGQSLVKVSGEIEIN